MKLYIATPINARQEPTIREKLVAAKHRVEMLKEILADDVRFKNYELISTFDFNDMYDTEEKAMSRCIYHVLTSDAIYLDYGWTASKGCNLEYLAAKIYGKQIFVHKTQGMDFNEITTVLPNVRWKIMDADRAKERRLELTKIDDDNVLLSINLRYIPIDMTIIDYIENIIQTGIVIIDKKE